MAFIGRRSGRQQRIDARSAQQAQRRQETNLAAIAKGVQPNRTPSAGFRAFLNKRFGAGGGAGANPRRQLQENTPPLRKKFRGVS